MSSYPGNKICVPDDISIINRSWTDEQRRIVWTLICKARRRLDVGIQPIIATAFIILQRYFRDANECCYELFILMTAALFTACKVGDCYRPVQLVYEALSRICQSAPSSRIRSLLGDREGPMSMNSDDLLAITRAELDLLKSINFNLEIDTPFEHFDRWKQTLKARIPNEAFIRLCNSVIVDICLMLCSAFCLDVPCEVVAAAATSESSERDLLPAETWDWVRRVKQEYGNEKFELAVASISEEKSKTAFTHAPASHRQEGGTV